MKNKTWIVITALLVAVGTLQLFQTPVKNLPVTHPIKAPEEVTQIFRRACYDCHSNETKLPWYDRIAPASWLANRDVRIGRSRFNFSTWDTLSKANQQAYVWEMVNMVLTNKMPLSIYTAMHPDAKLSAQDVAVLKRYANSLSPAVYHDTSVIKQAGHDFDQFKQKAAPTDSVPVAANGVAYIPGYQNWEVISTTNRFDNHSMRIIYGNAIAAKAIKQNHVKLLPEGSALVKVVWNSIEEKNGDITPGSFNNVQIMIKDHKRFAESGGWGFARFNGLKLKRYSDTPMFNTACFNCHKIADKTDFVFNLPPEK